MRNAICSADSSPARPMMSKTTCGWVWPRTTTRSISRASTASPAAAIVACHQTSGAVEFVGGLESRREVDRIAHDREAHHEFGTDAADEGFPGGDADAQIAVGRDLTDPQQLR